VKQLPVEMLQQGTSASSCMQMHIVIEEHYTGYAHSTPCVLNGFMQFFSVSQHTTSDVTVVPCCINSIISTPFLSQKTAATSFMADNICLNIFGMFGKCVSIHCFECSFGFNIHN
jgi:hypothetical protein